VLRSDLAKELAKEFLLNLMALTLRYLLVVWRGVIDIRIQVTKFVSIEANKLNSSPAGSMIEVLKLKEKAPTLPRPSFTTPLPDLIYFVTISWEILSSPKASSRRPAL
jgi:hypothetical protein